MRISPKVAAVIKPLCVLGAAALLIAARKPLWELSGKIGFGAAALCWPAGEQSALSTPEEPSVQSEVSEPPPSEPSAEPVSTDGEDYRISVEQIKPGSGDTVQNGVSLSNFTARHTVNIASQLVKSPVIDLYKNARPQILIIHTHTTESYLDESSDSYDPDWSGRSSDSEKTVVAVGEVVAQALNDAGYVTIHETAVFDSPEYNDSYERAGKKIEEILKKYSSIEMVIDIHRDSITRSDGTKVAPTATIDGRRAAQVMLVTGCNEETALSFPNWEYNLRMAVRLQQKIELLYPGLARPIYFIARRYNMHYTKNSLLVEVGSEVNTLSEAKAAAGMFAESLIATLDSL